MSNPNRGRRKAEDPFAGHRWLGKRVRVTVEGFVTGEMSSKAGEDKPTRLMVFIPIPDEPPDLHFGAAGNTFYARPEDVEVLTRDGEST